MAMIDYLPPHRQGGMTLVETVVSIVIVAIAMTGFVTVIANLMATLMGSEADRQGYRQAVSCAEVIVALSENDLLSKSPCGQIPADCNPSCDDCNHSCDIDACEIDGGGEDCKLDRTSKLGSLSEVDLGDGDNVDDWSAPCKDLKALLCGKRQDEEHEDRLELELQRGKDGSYPIRLLLPEP